MAIKPLSFRSETKTMFLTQCDKDAPNTDSNADTESQTESPFQYISCKFLTRSMIRSKGLAPRHIECPTTLLVTWYWFGMVQSQ